MVDPELRGVHDATGTLIAGTTNDDGGTRRNSRLTFAAESSATYYVAAGADPTQTGTYTLSVTTVTPAAAVVYLDRNAHREGSREQQTSAATTSTGLRVTGAEIPRC